MARRKQSSNYPQQRKLLDAVLQSKKPILKVAFERAGVAFRFRQMCYEFRARFKEEAKAKQAEMYGMINSEGNLFGMDGLEDPVVDYDCITITIHQEGTEAGNLAAFRKDDPAYLLFHKESADIPVQLLDPITNEPIELDLQLEEEDGSDAA